MAVRKIKADQKKNKPKKSRKGLKIFLMLFGLILLTVLLYQCVNLLNKAMVDSKTVRVDVDGEWGSSGDAPGQFKEPQAVATDAQGNFYVSDFSGHRIQKFDPNGAFLSSIGKEGKDEGDFEQPSGLFVDPDGNLFVCDTFNHRIEKFDSDGGFVKAWSHGFFGPRGIVGTQGRIYVTDTGNHQVQVFDKDGNFLTEWGKFGTSNGMFREPVGITADSQGNVYVADSDNCRVQKFDGNGKFIAAFRVSTWKGKNDEIPYLAFANGFIYASNASFGKSSNKPSGAVLKYDLQGKLVSIFLKKGQDSAFMGVAGIATDNQNHVYTVEKGNGRIARFTVPLAPAGK